MEWDKRNIAVLSENGTLCIKITLNRHFGLVFLIFATNELRTNN